MIDDLPPIADVVRRFDLAARRSLGQNFLFDLNLTAKIARGAGPLAGLVAVEIGPGPGGLTRALLAEGADHVIAIERDRRFLPALEEIAARYPGRVTLIEGDALLIDLAPLVAGRDAHVVANLPYNVGTPLLVRWLEAEPWPPWFKRLTLMFQREVAERIVATTGEPDDYGRLSVLANWRCTSEILFDVPPRAFNPPPKVTSSVVRLEPRASPLPCETALLSRVTREAFGHRRKMLRQSLKPVFAEPSAALAQIGIDPTLRAENVSVAGFVAIANAIRSQPVLAR